MPSGEPDPRLVPLGSDVERAHQRLDRVERVLRAISANVDELNRAAQQAASAQPTARAWLLIDDGDQARDDLADLTGWLAEVYLRYPDAMLPSCWLWHPAVVEELWWLRHAHHDAYQGSSYLKAADWHDRHRPGVVGRIRKWLRDCDLTRHQQPSRTPMVPLLGSAERVAEDWATQRTPPTPTPEEVTEADRYEHDQYRTKNP